MCLLAFLKSAKVLLLNMCNILGLSGLFLCMVEFAKFFSTWRTEKIAGLGISTQADTILYTLKTFVTN